MLLEIKKGQEHGLVITEDIRNKDNIMYTAYEKALGAVQEIARQVRKFPPEYSTEERSKLYSYSHNIVAFSGSRGQGKTSVMLSFSKDLGDTKKPKKDLADCSFTILDPIDPMVLEENQGILALILSRMYQLAEKVWRNSCANPNPPSSCRRCTEAEKNTLLNLFQKCLSGITAVKFRKGEEIRSLQIVHEISDSALLKENFYRLTAKLLQFTGQETGQSLHPFLVIQLDDTDFQIQKAYEILDDIRKYLTIPNAIILMATDMDLLRHTLTQHYLEEFGTGLKHETIDKSEVRKLESKYLDKLIPPTFAVYLPRIDDLIRQQEMLQIDYRDPEIKDSPNLLLPSGCTCTAADFSFQALVLRYIYQKTHIIFAEPDNRIHNLIPTTLRGLSQLLGLLSSMKEVPEVSLDSFPPDEEARSLSVEKAREMAEGLAEAVCDESDALERNLQLFEDYFLYDWVHTKLPKKEGDIIEQLSRTMPGERCRAAIIALREYGKPKNAAEKDQKGNEKAEPADYSYSTLVKELEKRKGHNRLLTEFYFTFAIQTFFSIQFHKTVLRQKRRAARAFLEDKSLENDLLLFDFTPESMDLPWPFDLKDFVKELEKGELMVTLDSLFIETADNSQNKVLLKIIGDGNKVLNSMDFLELFLELGSKDGKELVRGDFWRQKDFYLIQTSAIAIAINWDAHEQIRKISVEAPNPRDRKSYGNRLKAFLEKVDNAMKGINRAREGVAETAAPLMVSSHLENLISFAGDAISRSYLHRILNEAFGTLEPVRVSMDTLYKLYESVVQLKRCVRKVPLIRLRLHDAWINFVAVFRDVLLESAVPLGLAVGLLDDALNEIITCPDTEEERLRQKKSRFVHILNENVERVYTLLGHSEAEIRRYGETRGKKHDEDRP